MARFLTGIALVLFSLGLAVPAFAQILPFEVRGGVSATGVTDPGVNMFDPARLRDANVELLYTVPDLSAWAVLGELRPHLGGTMSFTGQENLIYGGLSWTVRAPLLPVWGEASLGGGWQSGALQPAGTPTRFGCAVVARAAATVGVDVLPGASVMATLSHLTDFGACNQPNNGRTDLGLRVGIRF
ncbi:Lipid A 3-O-deacylase (PagL) [Devosia equisanguinis]|uniref:Lipid A 3-O-deacylase (PagL) n=1 Tax=Devosia equisanguinis TaxID=2490941 RepID=A0A447IAI5_9HYPH|nr:hypothetical protein [Devosia equisanguinis]VDS04434.1 Lipid A 3-O-deacylase (PagL) [Devosia equisanguinis]